ncbi:MAG: TIGR00341 family protein [Phycisphaerales bacterium]
MLIVVHEPVDAEVVDAKVLPLFESREARAMPLDQLGEEDSTGDATLVVAYLSDAALKRLIEIAADRHLTLGVLPHPDGRHARLGYGIAAGLEDAAKDILGFEGDPPGVDVLSCNGEIVLNSVVIGDPFTATPGTAAADNAFRRTIRFIRLAVDLLSTHPVTMTITTAKGQQCKVAALGVIAVEHARSAVLSRRVIDDSAANDGMLHALIYAPRSVSTMLGFLVNSVLIPRKRAGAAGPSFVGHIKSESVRIAAATRIGVSIDAGRTEASEITMGVRRGAITLIPGRHLTVEQVGAEQKESFRVKGILGVDDTERAVNRRLPWVAHATPDEFKELFQMLREGARPSESFVMLMVLSTLLATFGLFADSAPVIIGAMILAPLMSPIVAMSMGLLRVNERTLLLESARSFAIGVGVALACSVLLTWLTPLRTQTDEIVARLNPTLLDMGVAVLSGVAGAYAHARAGVTKSLAGVAIAVALVPPLAVSGVGLGWGDRSVFFGAGLLFLTNFAGMILAGAATFLCMGYSPFRFSVRGISVAAAAVIGVSILLVPSFGRMVDEHRIIGMLDGWSARSVVVRDVDVRFEKPVRIVATLVSDQPIEREQIEEIKSMIEERVGCEVTLEAAVRVVR